MFSLFLSALLVLFSSHPIPKPQPGPPGSHWPSPKPTSVSALPT